MLIGIVNFAQGRSFLAGQLVSVVLPTFNRASSLQTAIASVLDQTHQELEIIVVDDGSTDNTVEVVEGIGDERVRYVGLAVNKGQSAARNIGVKECRASLIAFQDSDDVWHREKLALQVQMLEENPDVAGVYCDLDRHFLGGHRVIIEAPSLKVGRYLDDRPSLYQTYGLGIQSCVLRKDVIVGIGGFREDLNCLEDLELLLRIAYRHRLMRIPKPLVDYFESVTSVSKNPQNERRARVFLLSHYGLLGVLRYPSKVATEIVRCVVPPQQLSRLARKFPSLQA